MPGFQTLALLLVMLAVIQLPDANAWFFRLRRSSSRPSTTSSISADCNRPSGRDCGWYRRCLEAKIPCSRGAGPDYAIAYAEKFCNRYSDKYSSFSGNGQDWIDAVKKCLQEKLVPLIQMSPAPSCSTIKRTAFDSHVPCYTNPAPYAPSFCDLSLMDKARVLRTIFPAFGSELIETIKGGLKTISGCLFG